MKMGQAEQKLEVQQAPGEQQAAVAVAAEYLGLGWKVLYTQLQGRPIERQLKKSQSQ
jgi:hypothetical protein